MFQKFRSYIGFWVMGLSFVVFTSQADTLTGNFTPISQGSNVNLSAIGTLDWVHWGLLNMYSINRKSTVPQQISNFTLLYEGNSFAEAYQYTDNYNGYTWFDGAPSTAVTNTTTGLYVLAPFNPLDVNGFEITVPADTTQKTLQLFVGTYSARGKLTAYLSDSATGYTNTSLSNNGNGPGGVYTINFAASSSNQNLTVKWTLAQKNMGATDANVTLQAAALSATGVNNPPFGMITSPLDGATFEAPATVDLNTDALDVDGTVSKVEFYNEGGKIGQAVGASGQYSYAWSNVPAGRYVLTATVTDNGETVSTSSPITVFVNSNGGSLSGSVALPPGSVDLTSEGTADWIHWGLTSANSMDRKMGVAPQISNFVKVGTNSVKRYSDNFTSYGWTDGTPTLEANSTTGVYISGITNGFQLTAPADQNPRTLKVYVGLNSAVGNFQAYLSDFSASAYTDTSVKNISGNDYAIYTLNYSAASAGQTLTVRFTAQTLYDQVFGNITLQAASLSGVVPIVIQNPALDENGFSFSVKTDSNRSYTIQYTTSLSAPQSWQNQTNFVGDGSTITINSPVVSSGNRFYRVLAQ